MYIPLWSTDYRIFWTIRHTFSPQIWEGNGGVSYSPLAGGWWCDGGTGSQEAGAGLLLEEAEGGRSGAMLRALGWKEGMSQP